MSTQKGFTFFRSYYESLSDLPLENRNEILNAMIDYVFADIEPNLKGISKTIWVLIKPVLDTSKGRSNENSGAPKGNQNAKKKDKTIKKQSKNNQNSIYDLKGVGVDKDKDLELDIEIDNKSKSKDIDKESESINTPTLDLIVSYGATLGVDESYCKRFYNNYEATDWKIGDKVLTNWKAKLRQWVDKDLENGNIKIEIIEEREDGYTWKNGKRVL